MKKVSELTGAELDYWVAKASKAWEWGHELYPTMTLDPTFNGARVITYSDDRKKCILTPSNPMRQDPQRFNPSENWAIAGRIIENEELLIAKMNDLWYSVHPGMGDTGYWGAGCVDIYAGDCDSGWKFGKGETPLIAAMRAFVASKYGQEVGE